MSEAFWHIQGARTAGFYIGKDSMNSEQIWKRNLSRLNGYNQGKKLMDTIDGTNPQTDGNVQEDSIMHKANRAWLTWAKDNQINATNTHPETYKLMAEAFVDGYTNGFVKRFTEGA